MHEASRIGYAQARIQARFGGRPRETLWRELEAGRDLPHLLEILRAGGLRDAAESLAASMDGHVLESRLRGRWARACREVAGWYPEAWRTAIECLAWLPWLAPLGWLARRPDAAAWMQDDPLLGKLAAAEPAGRPDLLGAGPFAPFEPAWRAGGNLADAWHSHWRGSWPITDARARRGLERLDATLAAFLPGPSGQPFDELVAASEIAVTRVFRRHAGTPVAGLALLCLLALDRLRLRAALAVARSFGPARAA
jgi:hypothetical protein